MLTCFPFALLAPALSLRVTYFCVHTAPAAAELTPKKELRKSTPSTPPAPQQPAKTEPPAPAPAPAAAGAPAAGPSGQQFGGFGYPPAGGYGYLYPPHGTGAAPPPPPPPPPAPAQTAQAAQFPPQYPPYG